MNTFKLELTKANGTTETKTSGSRLDLINEARKKNHTHAVIKNENFNKIVWQSHKTH